MVLINPWTYLIIVANVTCLISSLVRINWASDDSEKNGRIMGISNILLWITLIKYSTFSDKYSFLANTMVGSGLEVFNGMVGIIPSAIGWAFYMNTVLF